jgi:hypothetical protein
MKVSVRESDVVGITCYPSDPPYLAVDSAANIATQMGDFVLSRVESIATSQLARSAA